MRLIGLSVFELEVWQLEGGPCGAAVCVFVKYGLDLCLIIPFNIFFKQHKSNSGMNWCSTKVKELRKAEKLLHHPPRSQKPPHIQKLVSHPLSKDEILCGPFPYGVWGTRTGLKIKISSSIAKFLSIVFVVYFVQKTNWQCHCYLLPQSICSHCLEHYLWPINRRGAKASTHGCCGEKSSLCLAVGSQEQLHCCSKLSLSVIGWLNINVGLIGFCPSNELSWTNSSDISFQTVTRLLLLPLYLG